jgi:hypothetical protein
VRRGPGGQAAGEGRVGVDVELEEVEEGVRHEGDGAVLFRLDAVVEFERGPGLVADREGGPFYLVGGVFDVLACFAGGESVLVVDGIGRGMELQVPVHALYSDWSAVVVGWKRMVRWCFFCVDAGR